MMVARPASNNVSPTVPRVSYICDANNGNAAANDERIAELLAIADAGHLNAEVMLPHEYDRESFEHKIQNP